MSIKDKIKKAVGIKVEEEPQEVQFLKNKIKHIVDEIQLFEKCIADKRKELEAYEVLLGTYNLRIANKEDIHGKSH